MTQATKKSEIQRTWHVVDVKDQILGRAAVSIAQLLMGKSKPYFVRNVDCGDYVVVVNAKRVGVSGKKEEKQIYYRHSGYPGGLKAETLQELRKRRPEAIVMHAVKGMLPQNKLRNRMMKRLFVFAGEEHSYKDKIRNTKY